MTTYRKALKNNWPLLPKLKPLKFVEIKEFEEPYKMCLFAYYGFNNHIKKHYNYSELNRNYINDVGSNLYLFCVFFGKIKLLKYLASINTNFYYFNYEDTWAYNFAIFNEKIKTMDYLVKKGIFLYYQDIDRTPYNHVENLYYYSVYFDKYKSMKYLENIGYNIYSLTLCDISGKTEKINAYMCALFFNHYKLLKHLEKLDLHLYAKNNFPFILKTKNRYKYYCYKFNIINKKFYLHFLFII